MKNSYKKTLKINLATKILDLYTNKQYFFIINYKGLNADNTFKIRKKIFETTSDSMIIIKNSLNKIALNNLEKKEILSNIKGQNAMIFTDKPIEIASILQEFIESKNISLTLYFDKEKQYNKDDFKSIASYKSEKNLKARLVRILSNNCSSFVRLLNEKASLVS